MKLAELIEDAGANAVVMADAGNGCGLGEGGQVVPWDSDMEEKYGDVDMLPLPAEHTSIDGANCLMASEWIIEGDGDNPYRVRLFF